MDKIENITETTEVDIEMWTELLVEALSKEVQWSHTIMPFMLFIFIVGLVGNLLTCIVIYYDKTMHTATNYYLFDLAVTDLLVTFAIILEIHENYNTDRLYYAFGELTCKIHFFLVLMLWNNGILIMTALAVERYVAICYPLTLRSGPVLQRVMKIISILWILAIAETFPEIWTLHLIQTEKASICFIVPTRYAKVLNGMLALVTFLIPLLIMTYVYAMIAFQMNIVQKKIDDNKTRVFNHKNNTNKVKKLVVALTVSFLVCWVPFFTIRILIFTWDAKQLIKWWIFWYKVSALSNWFSAVLNPLLFSLMSTKFRQSLKALWYQMVRGQEHHPELYR